MCLLSQALALSRVSWDQYPPNPFKGQKYLQCVHVMGKGEQWFAKEGSYNPCYSDFNSDPILSHYLTPNPYI